VPSAPYEKADPFVVPTRNNPYGSYEVVGGPTQGSTKRSEAHTEEHRWFRHTVSRRSTVLVLLPAAGPRLYDRSWCSCAF